MRVLAFRTLRAFWESDPAYADAEAPARAWYHFTERADWASPADVKASFGNASILQGGRVIFNLGGNKYRLVAKINYHYRVVYIRFIGTHAAYDRIDPQTI
jgi:mRNA interferase HigB